MGQEDAGRFLTALLFVTGLIEMFPDPEHSAVRVLKQTKLADTGNLHRFDNDLAAGLGDLVTTRRDVVDLDVETQFGRPRPLLRLHDASADTPVATWRNQVIIQRLVVLDLPVKGLTIEIGGFLRVFGPEFKMDDWLGHGGAPEVRCERIVADWRRERQAIGNVKQSASLQAGIPDRPEARKAFRRRVGQVVIIVINRALGSGKTGLGNSRHIFTNRIDRWCFRRLRCKITATGRVAWRLASIKAVGGVD